MDQEIVQEFCSESRVLLRELGVLLEELELAPENFKALESFGQKIDRIMGAAKSLEFHQMGLVSELCKTLSYKTAQNKNSDLAIIVIAFFFEAVEIFNEMIANLEQNKSAELEPRKINPTIARLEFISGRLLHIQRASVAINDKDLLDLSDTFNKLNKSK